MKRVDLLLDAVAAVPRLRLLVVGDGPLRGEVERRLASSDLAGRAEVTGWVDDPAALLAMADLYVLTSDAENCPLSLLEAMATGLPVVATAVGGVPEVVRDGVDGLLCPAGDVAAMTGALGRLAAEPYLRQHVRGRRPRADPRRLHARPLPRRPARQLCREPGRCLMRALTVIAEMGTGGAESVVADLAGHLVATGHEACVASNGGWRADALAADGVATLAVPLRASGPTRLARAVARLRRETAARPVDVVHAHNVRASLAAHLGTRAGRRSRPPLVTTVHGLADGDYARAARCSRSATSSSRSRTTSPSG